jgi:hypothetical protein
MDVRDLGPWGDLEEGLLARALAGAGVWIAADRPRDLASATRRMRDSGPAGLAQLIEGDRRVPWDIRPLFDASRDERNEFERAFPAEAIADAWQFAVGQLTRPVRLQIRSEWDRLDHYLWAAKLLGHQEVRSAPFVSARMTAGRANWQWPVRIGFLAGSAAESLHPKLAGDVGWDELVEWVTVEGPHTPCDLLLLSSPEGRALDALVPFADDLEVGCILAFGSGAGQIGNESPKALEGFLRRNMVVAWALSLVDLELADGGPFLSDLVREMSHDATLDVALRIAANGYGPQRPTTAPLLIGSPRALDEAHVTVYGGRLIDMLATANGGGPELPAGVGASLPLPPGPVSPAVLGAAFGDRDNFRFEHHGATSVARTTRAVEARADARPTPARPRKVQVDVFRNELMAPRGAGAFAKPVRGHLETDTAYQIAVSIRFPRRGKLQAGTTIDLSGLPQDQNPHWLTVTFQELESDAPAQRGRVRIKAAEESDAMRFTVSTGGRRVFKARIMISYRNRIMQMVRFEADVISSATSRSESGRKARPAQRLVVESSGRSSMSDLGHRRRFDFAMVANHTSGGDPVIGVLKEGRYRQVGLSDIKSELDWFNQALSKMATQVGDLTSPTNTRQLRDLAIHGTRLFNHLKSWQSGLEPLEPKQGRLQIVDGSPDAFFPVEFVYDKGLPNDAAPLCKNARKALLDGRCSADCVSEAEAGNVICPLGFWCLSRVIERHKFLGNRQVAGRRLAPDESLLLAEPATGRNTIRPFGGAVFAASDRVDAVQAGSIKMVAKALAGAISYRTSQVSTWRDWNRSIQSESPPLLVILCHTDKKLRAGTSAVQIEIGAKGEKEWLDVDGITGKYVLGPSGGPHPVLLLIGCTTALEKAPFSNAVANFQANGTAIVLSTLASILGEHAALTTAKLIEQLAQIADKRQITFGDALLKVRRELMADNIPMVLALVAFGDADWRLARTAR